MVSALVPGLWEDRTIREKMVEEDSLQWPNEVKGLKLG